MSRENSSAKARRLLVEGRVIVEKVDGRFVHATVRGDSGVVYEVQHDKGRWACPCPAVQNCSHAKAVMLITAPITLRAS